METKFISLLLIFILHPPTLIKSERYNVIDYGAKPDVKFDSSTAFSSAWKAACSVNTTSSVPPTIYVPQGRYLIGSALIFSGYNCKPMMVNKGIVLRIEGTLVAPQDYMVLENNRTWLSFESVTRVTISGGSLDGKGGDLWACKAAHGRLNCPSGISTLAFIKSKDITISGVISVNSQLYHIVINECENVQMQGLKILASGKSPNTDGIHVQQSSNVMIQNSKIGTGDDCVSVGAGASNLFIDNIVCGPGHGISIGSLGKDLNEPGVENVTVTRVVFKGTQNGARIKSWGRQSRGYVKNVLFGNITMDNVQNPIIIDQNYCPNNINCPGQESGVIVSDVTYQDIHGSSATEVAVKFDCSPKYTCSHIRMENVKLSFKDQIATSSCAHAVGTVAGVFEPISCIIKNN